MTQEIKKIMLNEEEDATNALLSSLPLRNSLEDLLSQGLMLLRMSGGYTPQYKILDSGAVYFYNDMPSAELQRFIEDIKNDEGY